MAKSRKRELEGAWPSVDVRCGDLNCAFDSFDCYHVLLRLTIFVCFYSVPSLLTLFMRSMFFALFFTRYQVNTLKLPLATILEINISYDTTRYDQHDAEEIEENERSRPS